MKHKEQGPIEILCEEIDATFTKNMESISILIAFTSVLVSEIEGMVRSAKTIAHLTGEEVLDETEETIDIVKSVLIHSDREELIEAASKAHLNVTVPDEGPCNHYIDMLSSCVSAIRFGLEQPCRSRHAADAADHIWKRKYGISLFDRHTSTWRKQWTRDKFYEALGVAAEA
ncbi:MAG: hypothetical protein JMN25_12465 [gamma proteobacterium endosymbiont of Lamellibrachia anaximandri]|nr:hypothetical protein [gamma proteobacterium endosymbiont of Lamellibrachia anaximandri]